MWWEITRRVTRLTKAPVTPDRTIFWSYDWLRFDRSAMFAAISFYNRTFVIVWSNSSTISSSTSQKLFPLVARPNGDASHDLHLQSLATIGGTCKRAITNNCRRWKVWPIVVNRPTSGGDQWPIVPSIVTT